MAGKKLFGKDNKYDVTSKTQYLKSWEVGWKQGGLFEAILSHLNYLWLIEKSEMKSMAIMAGTAAAVVGITVGMYYYANKVGNTITSGYMIAAAHPFIATMALMVGAGLIIRAAFIRKREEAQKKNNTEGQQQNAKGCWYKNVYRKYPLSVETVLVATAIAVTAASCMYSLPFLANKWSVIGVISSDIAAVTIPVGNVLANIFMGAAAHPFVAITSLVVAAALLDFVMHKMVGTELNGIYSHQGTGESRQV
jgi:hypothetical protein